MLDKLIPPFELFIAKDERIYWQYLLSAFTIAFFLFLVHKRDYVGTGKNAISVIFPKDVYWHRSSINDYLYFYTDILFYQCKATVKI